MVTEGFRDTMILFLDDDHTRCATFRSRCPSATIVNTADECISKLGPDDFWDEVHLDHDLEMMHYQDPSEEKSGMEVVRHIVLTKPDILLIVVHSYNEPAARVMVAALREAGYMVLRIPFVGRYADEVRGDAEPAAGGTPSEREEPLGEGGESQKGLP